MRDSSTKQKKTKNRDIDENGLSLQREETAVEQWYRKKIFLEGPESTTTNTIPQFSTWSVPKS